MVGSGARIGRRLSIALAVAATAVAVGLLSHPASAEVMFSQFDPPPLCSENTDPDFHYCIAQPNHAKYSDEPGPIYIDFPTVRVDINETVTGGVPALEDVTGIVTFTITDGGSPPSGYSFEPAEWPDAIAFLPIPDMSDPTADPITFYSKQYAIDQTRDSCDGKIACTYVTDESAPLAPGWYGGIGGGNGYLVQKAASKRTSAGRKSYGPGTGSLSAAYIPQVDDLDPPYVEVATTGSGLVSKAIAQATDPGEQPMQLHWDFGDGTTQLGGFGRVVSHTYATPGNYVITATATAADGRRDSATASAKIPPPRPILQAVARDGTTTKGAAAGTLQGWPDGAEAEVRYWTDGCPTDPDVDYQSAPGFSYDAMPTAEGTVSMDFNYLDPAANAFVLTAEADVPAGNDLVKAQRVSECVEMPPAPVYETTAATAIGATEVPVDSASVPIGNVAVIDAGADDSKQDLAEQREVTGHGSLIVAALDRAHPSDDPNHTDSAWVIDAGPPLAPYVLPGPPPDPVLGDQPPDSDGDGVPDASDACPNQAGPSFNNGCPVVVDNSRCDSAETAVGVAKTRLKKAKKKLKKAKKKLKRAKKKAKKTKKKGPGKKAKKAKKKLKKAKKKVKKAKRKVKSAESAADEACA